MSPFRIALAQLRYPSSPEESVGLAEKAIADAARAGARLVATPECYVPGYRAPGREVPRPDPGFLGEAWSRLAAACGKAHITAVMGTERVVEGSLRITVVVLDADGSIAGPHDKVQMAPEENGVYEPGQGRRVFRAGDLTFGVAICHEGWRYPETVRWAVRRGAQLVLHPHFAWHEPGDYVPTTFADPGNSFHEKALLCRAAENTAWVASINYATDQAPTTSAVVRPDGTLLAYQPYGKEGLLVADLDLSLATRLLATRCKAEEYGNV
ncbi:MAG TPA: carbon-nitrogen hydrolase family protein [Polyangiaceae bacterium]